MYLGKELKRVIEISFSHSSWLKYSKKLKYFRLFYLFKNEVNSYLIRSSFLLLMFLLMLGDNKRYSFSKLPGVVASAWKRCYNSSALIMMFDSLEITIPKSNTFTGEY